MNEDTTKDADDRSHPMPDLQLTLSSTRRGMSSRRVQAGVGVNLSPCLSMHPETTVRCLLFVGHLGTHRAKGCTCPTERQCSMNLEWMSE